MGTQEGFPRYGSEFRSVGNSPSTYPIVDQRCPMEICLMSPHLCKTGTGMSAAPWHSCRDFTMPSLEKVLDVSTAVTVSPFNSKKLSTKFWAKSAMGHYTG